MSETKLPDTTPAQELAEFVRAFREISEHRYIREFPGELAEAVGEAKQIAFVSLVASAGSYVENGRQLFTEFDGLPDEAFAGADADTCWLLRDLAETFRDESKTLATAADELEKATDYLWTGFSVHGRDDTLRFREAAA